MSYPKWGSMAKEGKYIYGVIKSKDHTKFDYTGLGVGVEGNPVYPLTYKAITAIVSDAPVKYYEPDEEHAMPHRKVVDEVIKECTILPAAFGSMLKSVGDIKNIMRRQYGVWNDLLKKMDGKREYDVKVFWDKEAVQKEIEETNEEVKKLKAELEENGTPRAKIQLKILLEDELIQRGNECVLDIHDQLKVYGTASKSKDLVGKKMIFNGAFLVKNEEEENFRKKIEELERKYPSLEIKAIGPCAPYEFATVRLKVR